MTKPKHDERKPAHPFVKYAGGKTQLLAELRKHVPEMFGTYYEPFVGGGALFFDLNLAGRHAVLCDANPVLMATYRAIRTDVERVIRGVVEHQRLYLHRGACGLCGGYGKHAPSCSRDSVLPSRRYYLKVRQQRLRSDVALAAWLIFLNKAGFNGLWRVNANGKFNVPPGRFVRAPAILDAANLRACSTALSAVTLVQGDFERGCAAQPGDFVYFDPPYWPVSETSDFTTYSKGGFSAEDQERLRDVALALKKRGVHVLLSNADVAPVRKLYRRGFSLRRVKARRAINSQVKKRGHVDELLIW
jgi:DNA adenine methylase